MTQAELNREVAQAAGETITSIKQMGFVELTPEDPDRDPLVVDWDQQEQERVAMFKPR